MTALLSEGGARGRTPTSENRAVIKLSNIIGCCVCSPRFLWQGAGPPGTNEKRPRIIFDSFMTARFSEWAPVHGHLHQKTELS